MRIAISDKMKYLDRKKKKKKKKNLRFKLMIFVKKKKKKVDPKKSMKYHQIL